MDRTTLGYEAEPSDLKALVEDLLAGIAEVTDPLVRYMILTADQALYDTFVSEIKKLRGAELRRMADDGATFDQIANVTGLGGKQRVFQLIAPADAKV